MSGTPHNGTGKPIVGYDWLVKKNKRKKKIKFALVVTIVALLAYVYHGFTTYSPAPSAANYFFEAYEGCKKTARKNLKSPASAKFPSTAHYTKSTDHTYAINGYVDAKNALGATIRSDYRCKVQIIDNGSRWRLISFEFR